MKAATLTAAITLAIVLTAGVAAEDQHDQHAQHMPHAQHAQHMSPAAEAATPVLKLDPDLQQLLKEEMNAVQKGMQDLLPLIAAGEWPEVANLASRIQQTFIMHQKLSPEQMTQLHQALPAEFIGLDQGFHQMAGRLSEAATATQPELATFYYYKLADSCMGCHARFATHRFPALAPAPATAAHASHQH